MCPNNVVVIKKNNENETGLIFVYVIRPTCRLDRMLEIY